MPDETQLEADERERDMLRDSNYDLGGSARRMSLSEAAAEIYRRTGRYPPEVLLAQAVSSE